MLLSTKTFDNAPVLQRIVNTQTLVAIQNSYDKTLERSHHPAEAIASFVSECPTDSLNARITRARSLHIGPRCKGGSGEGELIDMLASAFAKGNLFPVEYVADIDPFKSTKLMYNSAISPLAARAGVDNAELLIDPLTQKLFFALLRENYSILHAGLTLEKIGSFHRSGAYCKPRSC